MSKIILNKSAYRHNLKEIAKRAGGIDKIYLVGKDNFYGHGASLCATYAKELGIKRIALRSEDEARELEFLKFEDTLILSHIFNGSEDVKFSYAINSIKDLEKIKNNLKIHIKLDTLMHRNGISFKEIKEALHIAKKKNLKIIGFFTHFRSADELNQEFFAQKKIFNDFKSEIRKICKEFDIKDFIFHSHNSSALFKDSEIDGDFVRVGLAQFGYVHSSLKRVLSLFANKISSRILKKDQALGYGGIFRAKDDMKIATYDLGYGDGLFRFNGRDKLRLANNELILGKMSMDSFISVDRGDLICVMDDANIWADFFNTINYEILVKLSSKIKRSWDE